MSSKSFKKIAVIVGLSAWVLASFVMAQFVAVLLLRIATNLFSLPFNQANQTLVSLVVLAISYVLALVLVVGVPLLLGIGGETATTIKTRLGISAAPRVKQLFLSLPAYGVYLVLTVGFTFLVAQLLPGFDSNQVQKVGFENLKTPIEFILAFVALAIIPPVVEEMLFRGYLFGHLRRRANFLVTSLVVSAIFGLAHGQLNVGIDVFALSLVLCFLREKTGAIWVGMVLHMIKNAVAFTILFLHPDIVGLLKNLL